MNRNIVIAVIIIILLVAGYFIFTNFKKNTVIVPEQKSILEQDDKASPIPQEVDKKASFAIFTNGTFRVFTAAMYHNLSENVYIQADNPNIIRIKKDGITWNNFFSTLPFKLTHECLTTGTKETFCTKKNMTLRFYLNGEKKAQVLNLVIQNGDKLLVTYGKESNETIEKQLEKIPGP